MLLRAAARAQTPPRSVARKSTTSTTPENNTKRKHDQSKQCQCPNGEGHRKVMDRKVMDRQRLPKSNEPRPRRGGPSRSDGRRGRHESSIGRGGLRGRRGVVSASAAGEPVGQHSIGCGKSTGGRSIGRSAPPFIVILLKCAVYGEEESGRTGIIVHVYYRTRSMVKGEVCIRGVVRVAEPKLQWVMTPQS